MKIYRLFPLFLFFIVCLMPIVCSVNYSDHHGMREDFPSWVLDNSILKIFDSYIMGKVQRDYSRSIIWRYAEPPSNASNDFEIVDFTMYLVGGRGSEPNTYKLIERDIKENIVLYINDTVSKIEQTRIGYPTRVNMIAVCNPLDYPGITTPAVYKLVWESISHNIIKDAQTWLCFEVRADINAETYAMVYPCYHNGQTEFGWSGATGIKSYLRRYDSNNNIVVQTEQTHCPTAFWTWTNISHTPPDIDHIYNITIVNVQDSYEIGDMIRGYIRNDAEGRGSWAIQHSSEDMERYDNGYIDYGTIEAYSEIPFDFTLNQPGRFFINVSNYADGNIITNYDPWQSADLESWSVVCANDTDVDVDIQVDQANYQQFDTVRFFGKTTFTWSVVVYDMVKDSQGNINNIVWNGTYFAPSTNGQYEMYPLNWKIIEEINFLHPFKVVLYDTSWTAKDVYFFTVVPYCDEHIYMYDNVFGLDDDVIFEICHPHGISTKVYLNVKQIGGNNIKYIPITENRQTVTLRFTSENEIGLYDAKLVVDSRFVNDTTLSFNVLGDDEFIDHQDEDSFRYLMGTVVCLGFGGAFGYLIGPITVPFVAGTLAIILSRPEMGSYRLLPEGIALFVVALMVLIGLFLWFL